MPAVLPILFGAAFTVASAWALGAVLLRRLPVPRSIVLATGGAVLSLLVFLTLVAGIAGLPTFGAIGMLAIAAALRTRRAPPEKAPGPVPRILYPVFAAYGTLYFVHALAPEIQPDGVTYHLGLVAEYLRLGSFPDRVGFYEMVPQGMEMLFLFAFAFGQHSAAKLVHLAWLFATAPLFPRIGARMGIPPAASYGAALIYLTAPVVGVSGSSSYNDPALVFHALAAFYLLLAWRQEGKLAYLFPAGVAAGFCYAVKFPGIVALPAAVVAVLLIARRPRPPLIFAGAGLAMVLPWMARNLVVAGNPLAPLFNTWFPNPWFHPAMEQVLADTLATYGGVNLWRAPWELAVGGRLQGIVGPALLLMPLGLAALRRRAGRLLWIAAAVLALPWLWNMGTRFLLPAIPFAALALAMALPRPLFWAVAAVQVVASWPAVLSLYTGPHTWRLRGFPVEAALRLQPEPEYLAATIGEYQVARTIQSATAPGERVFALLPTPKAYLDRETLDYWHSAQADQLLDTLKMGGLYLDDPFYDLQAAWPPRPLHGVRFRLTGRHTGQWCVHEVRLFLGANRVYASPQWSLTAWPHPGDVGGAFDDNLATRWLTWGPMRPGMFVEAVFDRPQVLSRAVLVSHTPVYGVPVVFEGLVENGRWHRLSPAPEAVLRRYEDLRRDATRAVKRAGFRYILASVEREGNSPLAQRMAAEPWAWGMSVAARIGPVYLFRIE